MEHKRYTHIVSSVVALLVLVLTSCAPAAAPTQPAVPPTAIPPTAVPPTPTAEPVTLTIGGAVTTELFLSDSALHALPAVTLTLEHPKNGPVEYTGVRLNDLLTQAGLSADGGTLTLTASDGYAYDLDVAAVLACADCLVAFDPSAAGIYNAAMPDQTSKAWVKNLVSITVVAPEAVTFTVTGLVDNELKLTDTALHAMTVVTLNLEHPKNGAMDYTGVRLSDLLAQAGIKASAVALTFTAADGFTNEVDLATVQACADCLLAFDSATPGTYMLAMPGQTSGKAWVNGVVSITVK
jgi:DMSO/TMAO reductase YedYZ molybdopterin-dependent catalytic subunit